VLLLADLRRGPCSESSIVLLATRFDPAELQAYADLRVAGYLLWSDLSRAALWYSLAAIAAADVVVASRGPVFAYVEAVRRSGPPPCAVNLSAREQAILCGLADGLTQEQVAHAQHLSLRTVQRAIIGLEEKLEAPSLFVLGKRASDLGLIYPAEWRQPATQRS
jgi:DNA-binding NarL/FixJ family response regulator